MFASKTPRDLNRDPKPLLCGDSPSLRHPLGTGVSCGARFAPRPAYDASQHNEPNPLLVRFRKWVEGETLADPHWAAEWLEAMNDPNVEGDAARALDALYEAPYRRRERAEQEEHARRVIGRALRLARKNDGEDY